MGKRNPVRPQTSYFNVERVNGVIAQAGTIRLVYPFNSYSIIKTVAIGCNAVNARLTHVEILLGTQVYVAGWPHKHLVSGTTMDDVDISWTNWEEHMFSTQGCVVGEVVMGAAGTAYMDVLKRSVHMGLDRPETYGDLPDLRERIRRFLS